MCLQVLDFAQVDSWRAQRTGFPEVLYGAGKSAEQIAAIMQQLAKNDQVAMATRIEPEVDPCKLDSHSCLHDSHMHARNICLFLPGSHHSPPVMVEPLVCRRGC